MTMIIAIVVSFAAGFGLAALLASERVKKLRSALWLLSPSLPSMRRAEPK